MKMRASRFELCCKCRKSFYMKSYSSQPSTEGRAFHEVMFNRIQNKPDDIEPLKIKYGLSDDAWEWIKYWAFSLDINIPEDAQVLTEEKLTATIDGIEVSGSPDFVIIQGVEAYVWDYKYGRVGVTPAKSNGQMFIYALLVLINFPEVQDVNVVINQPRLEQVTEYLYVRDTLDIMIKSVLPVLRETRDAEKNNDYCYGEWCSDCFGAFQCPAFGGQMIKLAQHKDKSIKDPETALKLLIPIAKACQYMSRKVDTVAQAYVDEFGGIPLGSGMVYKKVEKTQDEVVPELAIPVLKEALILDSTLNKSLKLSKTTIYSLLKDQFPGKLRKVVKDWIEKLRQDGGIRTVTKTQYKIVKEGEEKLL